MGIWLSKSPDEPCMLIGRSCPPSDGHGRNGRRSAPRRERTTAPGPRTSSSAVRHHQDCSRNGAQITCEPFHDFSRARTRNQTGRQPRTRRSAPRRERTTARGARTSSSAVRHHQDCRRDGVQITCKPFHDFSRAGTRNQTERQPRTRRSAPRLERTTAQGRGRPRPRSSTTKIAAVTAHRSLVSPFTTSAGQGRDRVGGRGTLAVPHTTGRAVPYRGDWNATSAFRPIRPAAFLASVFTVTLDALPIPCPRRFRPLHHRSSSSFSAFGSASPVLLHPTRSSFGPPVPRHADYALG
jgi:hypothetical protein